MTPEVKKRIEQLRHGIVPEGYKRTKAGIYPEDWKEYTLGDIYTERKEPGNENLPLLMVSIHSGVSDGEVDEAELPKKVKRIEDKSQYKRAASGDLVFNMMRAWQGAIGTVRTEGMVSPAYIVAEPNGLVDPLFMDYYMKTARMIHTIHRQSYGVTDFRLRLYWDSFAPIRCVLPTVVEQHRIAEIFTAQDKVIELKEKLLAEKQRQKKYLMQSLLMGNKRLSGFTEEWTSMKLGDIGIFYQPSTISQEKLVSSGYPVFGANGQIGFYTEYNHVTEQILITCRGATCGCVNISKPYSWINGNAMVFNVESNTQCSKRFMFHLCDELDFRRIVSGTGQPQITAGPLESFVVSIPLLEEQSEIAMVLDVMDKEIGLLEQGLEQEKQKKKALMQLLLTGIVRVNA